MSNEIRYIDLPLEIRAGDKPILAGHAAIFNSVTDLGYFTEEVAPGAFANSINDNADIRALYNHNSDRVLGRRSAGTFSLREDEQGLYVEINPPASAADIIEAVQRKDITGMSIGFRVRKDQWAQRAEGKKHRRLLDVDLKEVSIVAFPAYQSTNVGLRSAEQLWTEYQAEIKTRLGFYARRARLLELD